MNGAAIASGAVGFLVIAAEWAAARRLRRLGMPWTSMARLTAYSVAAAVPAWLLTLPGRTFTTVLAVAVFATGAVVALVLARPLSEGEAADIAGTGVAGGVLRLLEAKAANG
jgi:hypothetical protein